MWKWIIKNLANPHSVHEVILWGDPQLPFEEGTPKRETSTYKYMFNTYKKEVGYKAGDIIYYKHY